MSHTTKFDNDRGTSQSIDRSNVDKNDGDDKENNVWNKTYTNYHEFQSRDDCKYFEKTIL